ncbi:MULTISPECIES: hypothetical protein [unclassified Haladaptatus]|uniref:DUF7410 domain-containing protein n=1 Tax=unclassified Haladaptatus TaxID=2622732 RepID=UPI0023E78872|nr:MULTISPECIES: hypothetical protein [unclassified Haladaptatus]
MTTVTPDTVVFETDPPAVYCPYCERPFDTDLTLALHVGEAHQDEWSDTDQTAYEDALAEEDDDLWLYHMKIVVGLAILYGVFIAAYMIVLG